MGRDVLQKLGIILQQKSNKSPGNKIDSISSIATEKNIIKWIYKKYSHLCKRLGKSKNQVAKSIFKQNHAPIQQKDAGYHSTYWKKSYHSTYWNSN